MNLTTRRESLAWLGAGSLVAAGRAWGAPAGGDPLAGLTLRPDQISQLQAALGRAGDHGLANPLDSKAAGLLASPIPTIRALGVGQLVDACLSYARQVRAGALPAANFPTDWGLRPQAYDPAPDFAAAIRGNAPAAWLDSLPPPYLGYDQLRASLGAYRKQQAAGGWPKIGAGVALKAGSSGARVALLRQRLTLEDPAAGPADGGAFDETLTADLMRAQKRYGLSPTGVLDKATQTALDVPIERRIDQISANMERWRWMPRTMPIDRVQVNIAAAVLTLFSADQPTLSMRAVTGAAGGHETPMLQSRIDGIVFNPPWNVPDSIAKAELWPKERAHPGYLATHGYKVIGGQIQQQPGPACALGKVKFDFQNPYGVYLHDTPTRGAFSDYERLQSHGCVRLQQPKALVHAVMSGDPKWTSAAIDKAYDARPTVRAPVAKPVSVYLLYWTAYQGPDGVMNFRDDPYGWDAKLTRLLA